MSDDPFLAAIIEAPDDDLPRHIYADRLDEHGQPERAEFIRVQCRLAAHEAAKARLSKINPYPEGLLPFSKREALRRRLAELWVITRPLFQGELERAARSAERSWAIFPDWKLEAQYVAPAAFVRRGFLEKIACSWEDWLARHEAIRAVTPLKKVRLTTAPLPELRDTSWTVRARAPACGEGACETYIEDTPYGWGLPGCRKTHYLASAGRKVDLTWRGFPGYDPSFPAKLLGAEFPGIEFELLPA